jgi:aspartyl aminopeptidase
VKNTLVDFRDPVAVIPNLAIHLDRDANSSRNVNKQTDLPPVLMMESETPFSFRQHLVRRLNGQGIFVSDDSVIDYDFMLYDPNGPMVTGLNREFITCGRLDNLVSCYCGAMAMIDGGCTLPAILVLNDHEEVGSVSASGAGGNFLSSILSRICSDTERLHRAAARSLMISADNAHGVHPSFKDKYEPNHRPLINGGPVIKYNANQRYATDSRSGAAFRYLCRKAEIPFQEYVVRTDMACGSTIGPMTSGETGIRTVDAGIPMLAMHSIRETAGFSDAYHFYGMLKEHMVTLID